MNPKKVALQISGWVNLPEEVISALLHPVTQMPPH